jgi:hypothetical protein
MTVLVNDPDPVILTKDGNPTPIWQALSLVPFIKYSANAYLLAMVNPETRCISS